MPPVTGWVHQEIADGRYRLDDKLGEGGMGFVYRAHDRNLDCSVVIKVPRRELLDDAEFVRRFELEIRSLVKLTHPHIVKVTDVGMHDGSPFAVMQYLEGGSVEDRVPKDAAGHAQPLPLDDVLHWLSQVAAALDFIHQRGYVHRDVKPGNILFDGDNNVFLSDFGVAKVISLQADTADRRRTQARTGTGLVMGTPDYMAPELILGKEFDGRVDQYALAVMVFELLGGRMPFDGPTPAAVMVLHTTQPPPALHSIVPTVGRAVAEVIARGMAKSPHDRFSTCTEFAQALKAAAASTEPAELLCTCPACYVELAVPADLAGSAVRCQNCGGVLQVPPAPGQPAAPQLSDELIGRSLPGARSSGATPAPLRPTATTGQVAQGETLVQAPAVPAAAEVLVASGAGGGVGAKLARKRALIAVVAVVAGVGVVAGLVALSNTSPRGGHGDGPPPTGDAARLFPPDSDLAQQVALWNGKAKQVEAIPKFSVATILQSRKYHSSQELETLADDAAGAYQQNHSGRVQELKTDLDRIEADIKIRELAMQKAAAKYLDEPESLVSTGENAPASKNAASARRQIDAEQDLLDRYESEIDDMRTTFSRLTRRASTSIDEQALERELVALREMESAAKVWDPKPLSPTTLTTAAEYVGLKENFELRYLGALAATQVGHSGGVSEAKRMVTAHEGSELQRVRLIWRVFHTAGGAPWATDHLRESPRLLSQLDQPSLQQSLQQSPEDWRPLLPTLLGTPKDRDTVKQAFLAQCKLQDPSWLPAIKEARKYGELKNMPADVVTGILQHNWTEAYPVVAEVLADEKTLKLEQLDMTVLDELPNRNRELAAALGLHLLVAGTPQQVEWSVTQLEHGVIDRARFLAKLGSSTDAPYGAVLVQLLRLDSPTSLETADQLMLQSGSRIKASDIPLSAIGTNALANKALAARLSDKIWTGDVAAKRWVLSHEFGEPFGRAMAAVQRRHAEQKAIVERISEDFRIQKSNPRNGSLQVEIPNTRILQVQVVEADERARGTEELNKHLEELRTIFQATSPEMRARGLTLLRDMYSYLELVKQGEPICEELLSIHQRVVSKPLPTYKNLSQQQPDKWHWYFPLRENFQEGFSKGQKEFQDLQDKIDALAEDLPRFDDASTNGGEVK